MVEAATRVDAVVEAGDVGRYGVWKQVLKAVAKVAQVGLTISRVHKMGTPRGPPRSP